jgi:hypothetical protein
VHLGLGTTHKILRFDPGLSIPGRYKPVIRFENGWEQTKEWFKKEWAPKHRTTEEIRAKGWS